MTEVRTVVKKKLGFENFYVYTAVSPKTGKEFFVIIYNYFSFLKSNSFVLFHLQSHNLILFIKSMTESCAINLNLTVI